MNYILYPAILVILGLVAYQDFKHREVLLWLFVLFMAESIAFVYFNFPGSFPFVSTLVNVAIVIFQIVTITVFYSLRNKKFTSIINSKIGMGDLVFLVNLCVWFSPFNFTCFIVVSMIAGILLYLILKKDNIPLAGVMSLMMAAVLVVKLLTDIDTYDDYYLIQILGLR